MNEPILVSSMRRRPNGQVVLLPDVGPKAGTSTQGFLSELDEYVQSVKAAVWHEAYNQGLSDSGPWQYIETPNPYKD